MQSIAARRSRRGFTLAELLVVITIIGLLAAMILPAIDAIGRHVKEGAARMECKGIEASMMAYCMDWGEYPPDSTPVGATLAPPDMDRAQCLVYYLGTAFRVGDAFGSTRNGGPYYDFPAKRFEGTPPRFVDVFQRVGERTVYYYQFDNNEREDGDEVWDPDKDDYNINVSNVHPTSVDIWSAGYDGVDFCYQNDGNLWDPNPATDRNPTQTNMTTIDIGDDVGNW